QGDWSALGLEGMSHERREKAFADAEAMVARWEQRHPFIDTGAMIVFDPLNALPGGLIGKGANLAKLKTANILLKDALTAEEAAQLAERGVTMRDLVRLGRSEARIGNFITKQTG